MRQEDQEFETSLDYIVRPHLKNQTKQQKKLKPRLYSQREEGLFSSD
jgi:hypothetical protein